MLYCLNDALCTLECLFARTTALYKLLFKLYGMAPFYTVQSCTRCSTHERKSWDMYFHFAFSHTSNKELRMKTSLMSIPSLYPTFNILYGTVHLVPAVSPEFQHCIGWERGQQRCIFKRIAVLFQTDTDTFTCRCCKTDARNPWYYSMLLSQGCLSTIVFYSCVTLILTVIASEVYITLQDYINELII